MVPVKVNTCLKYSVVDIVYAMLKLSCCPRKLGKRANVYASSFVKKKVGSGVNDLPLYLTFFVGLFDSV